jgi:hypothetical protein
VFLDPGFLAPSPPAAATYPIVRLKKMTSALSPLHLTPEKRAKVIEPASRLLAVADVLDCFRCSSGPHRWQPWLCQRNSPSPQQEYCLG